jgi:hypothetical protein
MKGSKLVFSAGETDFLENREWILTKHRLMRKIGEAFGEIAAQLQQSWHSVQAIMPELLAAGPKISTGERYDDMPWIMLDFPRKLTGNNGFFALRTFFWWGHYFSIQWIVSGNYHIHFSQNFKLNPLVLPQTDRTWLAGVTADPWNSRLPHENLQTLEDSFLSELPQLNANEFFKLCTWFDLNSFTAMEAACTSLGQALAAAVPIQLPKR